jgi:aryl-alcohol dehydrogenase-like predicted oxidoreductase/enamine deaminase RidA (YjgF/YER057c/UK114 family)
MFERLRECVDAASTSMPFLLRFHPNDRLMTGSVERMHLAPDLEISRVVTGLWQIADMERDGKTLDAVSTAESMVPYVEAGFTTFDMADHYGSAEVIAGRFRVQHHGAPAQLFTKWVPKPGPTTMADVRAAVERAVERMRGKPIDLMQFHAWTFADAHWLDALSMLAELRDEGLLRHIGVTNFDAAHLRVAVASGIPIVSNQVSYSLLDQRASTRMASVCAQYDVKLLAYGTVAGGLLSDRWLMRPAPPATDDATWSLMKYRRFMEAAGGWDALQRVLAAASTVAEKHHVSIANVACRFILDKPAVAGVIVGARLGQREHIADNLRISTLRFDDEDRHLLHEALATLTPIPGDCGDEYRRAPYLTASGDLSHHVDAFPSPYPVTKVDELRSYCVSGTPWEPLAGYSRATRIGNAIHVSGSTATHGEKQIGGGDPAAQTHFVIDKLEGAIIALGGKLEDVVRTRVFVHDMSHADVIARAHGERFGHIMPANSMVEARLIGDGYLVEIEADAQLR